MQHIYEFSIKVPQIGQRDYFAKYTKGANEIKILHNRKVLINAETPRDARILKFEFKGALSTHKIVIDDQKQEEVEFIMMLGSDPQVESEEWNPKPKNAHYKLTNTSKDLVKGVDKTNKMLEVGLKVKSMSEESFVEYCWFIGASLKDASGRIKSTEELYTEILDFNKGLAYKDIEIDGKTISNIDRTLAYEGNPEQDLIANVNKGIFVGAIEKDALNKYEYAGQPIGSNIEDCIKYFKENPKAFLVLRDKMTEFDFLPTSIKEKMPTDVTVNYVPEYKTLKEVREAAKEAGIKSYQIKSEQTLRKELEDYRIKKKIEKGD